MQREIKDFRNYYATQVIKGIDVFLKTYGREIIGRIQSSLNPSRNTIYIFGNGGSHAISRCLEYSLQSYALAKELPIRIQTGIDFHSRVYSNPTAEPGNSFLRVLETEKANSDDLIILISGSGNSDNLCRITEYAREKSIPIFALIGSNKGRLKELLPAANCFVTPLDDQQISEDIIQSVSYFIDQPISSWQNSDDWANFLSRNLRRIKSAIENLPVSFIQNMVDAVKGAFESAETVWVLGFEHPSLSVCAEHTAHNLYWDSIYQVPNPPQRIIRSSPTICDFSGISNDRRKEVVSNLIGFENNRRRGMALLYTMSLNEPSFRESLDYFTEREIPVFILAGKEQLDFDTKNVFIYSTGLEMEAVQAGVSQIMGHMLGRLVRMKLLQTRHLLDKNPNPKNLEFLVNFDLAQRRLIDESD